MIIKHLVLEKYHYQNYKGKLSNTFGVLKIHKFRRQLVKDRKTWERQAEKIEREGEREREIHTLCPVRHITPISSFSPSETPVLSQLQTVWSSGRAHCLWFINHLQRITLTLTHTRTRTLTHTHSRAHTEIHIHIHTRVHTRTHKHTIYTSIYT